MAMQVKNGWQADTLVKDFGPYVRVTVYKSVIKLELLQGSALAKNDTLQWVLPISPQLVHADEIGQMFETVLARLTQLAKLPTKE